MARRAAMTSPPVFDPMSDPTPMMLQVQYEAGKLDPSERDEAMAQWVADWKERGAPTPKLWLRGRALTARDAEIKILLGCTPEEMNIALSVHNQHAEAGPQAMAAS